MCFGLGFAVERVFIVYLQLWREAFTSYTFPICVSDVYLISEACMASFQVELKRELTKRGIETTSISYAKNNHLIVTLPSGRKIFGPCTPSDHRSLLNVVSKIKRAMNSVMVEH